MPGKLKTEPAIIVSLVAAILGLAASFGLSLSQEQTAAIMAVVTILAGLVTRSRVSPSGE
jgi:hypothetical protein